MTKPTHLSMSTGIDLPYATELLRQYPEITENQADQLSDFIRRGPPVEVALLRSTEGVKQQLERFTTERAEFNSRMRDALVIGVMLLMVAIAMYLLWDIGEL